MTGYILCADILGFRQIIGNLAPDEATRRVEEWTELVSAAVAEYGVENYQTISDTLFAAAPSTEVGLRCLVNLSRRLLNDGVRRSLPIRGGISHGEYVWGSLILVNVYIRHVERRDDQLVEASSSTRTRT